MNIFVYGTLKKDFHNHHYLEDAEFICGATTKEKYPMVNVEEYFPYLINKKGIGYHIKGELYKIDEAVLSMLDILEGYPELFMREKIPITSFGIEVDATVYFVKEKIYYQDIELLEEFN